MIGRDWGYSENGEDVKGYLANEGENDYTGGFVMEKDDDLSLIHI